MKLLQEFFSREIDPNGVPYYHSRIDGRWKTETIQALAKYLHDQNARVAFTRDFHPKYNFIKGKNTILNCTIFEIEKYNRSYG